MIDAEFHLVETFEEAEAFMHWLGERRSILAVDTETTGLKWWTSDFTRLVQMGDGKAGWALPVSEWRGLIRDALSRYSGDVVFHNAQFDLHALTAAGLPLPQRYRVHDTLKRHALTDPLSAHGLKRIAEKLYGHQAIAGEIILSKGMRQNKWTWATVPVNWEPYWAYACLDTVLTARLFEDLPVPPEEAYRRELDVSWIMYECESRGMQIDESYTYGLALDWAQEMDSIKEKLDQYGLANPNSRVQLLAGLQAEIKFEPTELTDTGEPKLDEGILATLPGEIAPSVLRYRRLRKWSSAYLQHFLNERDSGGRIHASINTTAARTGRMSITGPPLQTLPRGTEIRDCICAAEGRKLLAVDYDTMELRMLASFAGEIGLIDAFNSGVDLHTYAAATVYGKSMENVTPAERQITKNTQYGLVYGAGAAKIAQTAGVSVDEAKAFLDTYNARFPGVHTFMDAVVQAGRDRANSEGNGYISTTGGRRIPVEQGAEYKLVNYLIQGSCADVLKSTLVELDNAGLTENLLLPVHDELLFELPAEDFDSTCNKITEIMEYKELLVTLSVHASRPLDRWGDNYRKEE